MLIEIKPSEQLPGAGQLLALSMYQPTAEKLALWMDRYAANPDYKLYAYGVKREDSSHSLVGVIGLRKLGKGKAVITHIAVTPLARGRGAGRRMILESMDREQIHEIEAETDRDAVDFYRACGFQVASIGMPYPGVERFRCTLLGRYDHDTMGM